MNNESTKNVIPDVTSVITSIADNTKAFTTVVNAVINSTNSITNKFKASEINLNAISSIENITISYSKLIRNVIKALCTDDKGEFRDLAVVLGRISETDNNNTDKNGKPTKTTKFTAIEAAMQIPKVFDSIFDIFEKVGDMRMNFRKMLLFKIKIKQLKAVITNVFGELLNVFSGINVDRTMNTVLGILTKEPETIINRNKSTSKSESDGDQTVSFSDNDTETITKQGRLGLLDVFEKTFTLIGTLNNLNVPNLIKTKFKMRKMKISLEEILKELTTFTSNQIKLQTVHKIRTLESLLIGTKNSEGVREGGLLSVIDNIGKAFQSIKRAKWYLGIKIKTGLMMNTIIKFVEKIDELKLKLDLIDLKTLQKSLVTFSILTGNIKTISIDIAMIAAFSAPTLLGRRFMACLLKNIISIIQFFIVITKKFRENSEDIDVLETTVETIHKIIAFIRNIAINIVLIAIIAVPASIATIVVAGFVIVLTGFLWVLKLFSVSMKSLSKDIQSDLSGVIVLLSSLLIVGLAILTFALIVPIIIAAITKHWIGFILVLLGALLITTGVMFVAKWLSKMSAKYSIAVAINMAIIVGSILMAALVILVAAVVGNMLKESDSIKAILWTLSGMIAISVIMVALGMALSVAAPGIGMAIAGLTPVVVLLGMMVGAGMAIMKLAELEMSDKIGEYDKDKGVGKGAMGNVGKILSFVKWLIIQLDDVAAGEVNGIFGVRKKSNVSKARNENRFMKQVKGTINTIVNIANNIKELSKIKFTQQDVNDLIGSGGSIESIFNVIKEIETKIFGDANGKNGLMSEEDKKSKLRNIDIILPHRLLKKAFNNRESQAKRKLNRINRIIKTLGDISVAINSIKDLEINEETILSKIQKLFTFINKLENQINKQLLAETVIIEAVGENGIKGKKQIETLSNSELRKSGKRLTKIDNIINSVQNICNALNSVKDIKLTDTDKMTIDTNVTKMFGSINSISSIITNESKKVKVDEDTINAITPLIDYIGKLDSAFSKMSNADSTKIEKNVDTYVKFVKSVNTIEVQKAEKTAQLFEKMSQFSSSIKGDFDKLAEALSEKMLPVLEDLKDVMEKVPEKLDTGFANTSASIAAANAPVTVENVAAQLNRENPDKDKDYIEKLLDKRMAEKAQQEANSTAAKLDELITLLKGFGPQVAVVKTV